MRQPVMTDFFRRVEIFRINSRVGSYIIKGTNECMSDYLGETDW